MLKETEFEDCVGPESLPYRRSIEYIRSLDGMYLKQVVPGNKTGCLMARECSLEPWNRTTLQECMTTGLEGYCGQCLDQFCHSITKRSRCYHIDVSPTYCNSINGTYELQSQFCYLPDRKTEVTCLTGPQCRDAPNDPWRCDRTICLSPVTNSMNCTGDYRWDLSLNKCILRETIFRVNQTQCPNEYVPGVRFEMGRYESPSQCPVLTCKDQDCCSGFNCDIKCSRRTSPIHDVGVCVNTFISDYHECVMSGGRFINQGMNKTLCTLMTPKSQCTDLPLAWLNCSTLDEPNCTTTSFSAALQCTWSSNATCNNQTSCELSGTCIDYELEGGFCVFEPDLPLSCVGEVTQHGWCIDRNATSESLCISPRVWKRRAMDKYSCESQGSMCQLGNGLKAPMNHSRCYQCNGAFLGAYKWQKGKWLQPPMINTSWIPIEWRPRNRWIKALSIAQLHALLYQAAAKSVSRLVLNRFYKKHSTFLTVLDSITCDCMNGNTNCFSPILKGRRAECILDPSVPGSCDGVTFPRGMFFNGTVVEMTVDFVSAATFINATIGHGPETNKTSGTKIDPKMYQIIQDGSSAIIGQVVGDGKLVNASQPINLVCLEIDPSIPISASYSIFDLAQEKNGILYPMQSKVTIYGNRICAAVPPFTTSLFFPISRSKSTGFSSSTGSAAFPTTTASSSMKKQPLWILSLVLALIF